MAWAGESEALDEFRRLKSDVSENCREGAAPIVRAGMSKAEPILHLALLARIAVLSPQPVSRAFGEAPLKPSNRCSMPQTEPARRRLKSDTFFSANLAETDPEIAGAIANELGRQSHEIELIASENIVSRAVLEAQGSVMTNKYAEGYPGKRYYGGCEFVDVAETLAIERAKKLFGCEIRQRSAELRQPDEPGGVPGPSPARRHLHGPRSGRGRASDARLARQHVGQVVQGGALRRQAGRPAARL